jgi:hypothetical protein
MASSPASAPTLSLPNWTGAGSIASGSHQTLGTRQAMSKKGGKRAYRGRLGKDRSVGESRHSSAS